MKRGMRVAFGLVLLLCILIGGGYAFMSQASFGKLPEGARLDAISQSPHYEDGAFRNTEPLPLIKGNGGIVGALMKYVFSSTEGQKPARPMPSAKTDLRALDRNTDTVVWLGHSSYFVQLGGRRILIDPVFSTFASPVFFANRAFEGTNLYTAEDMPDIDYLLISHDHWDHLDYNTVKKLRDRIGTVICPLGVGEHFEYWGFDKKQIVELDWNEDSSLETGFKVYCLPARHFSGRGLSSNQSLWASFLLQAPSQNIYIGGDGGYDTHYAEIGERFPNIDLAILENGQYNEEWKLIHMMPEQMSQAAKDLNAKKILTVHHSKYALARHPWDEPLQNAENMRNHDSLNVLIPEIGEIVKLE